MNGKRRVLPQVVTTDWFVVDSFENPSASLAASGLFSQDFTVAKKSGYRLSGIVGIDLSKSKGARSSYLKWDRIGFAVGEESDTLTLRLRNTNTEEAATHNVELKLLYIREDWGE